MKTLIIGNGEIGSSLFWVLDYYNPTIIDKDESAEGTFEIIHICFPYSEKFVDYVKEYQKKYKPKFTVIHSTVPVGTSEKCNAIHSPCLGIHPHLEESMKIFIKFLSGKDASSVADYFRRVGMRVYLTDKSETTELVKALCTTFYGLCVEFTKEVKRLCDQNNVPFEFWTIWTNNYNEGYRKLGYPEFVRPNLTPIMKNIGGHCVLPNLNFINSDFSKWIKSKNV